MKRYLVFVIVVVFFLTAAAYLAKPVKADFTPSLDYPFDPVDCGQGDQAPCHVNRDVLDQVIKDPKKQPTWSENKNPKTGVVTITYHPPPMPFNWGDGGYAPAGAYNIPKFINPFGQWLINAFPLLQLGNLEQVTVNNTNPQNISTCARRCVYDNDGKLVDNEICKEIIKTDPIPGIPQLVQGSAFLSSHYALEKKQDQVYQRPTEEIRKLSIYSCPDRRTGQDQTPTDFKATGMIVFDLFTWIENNFQAAIGYFVHETQIRNPSKKTPFFDEVACLVHSCTPDILADSSAPADYQQRLIQQGGFVDNDTTGNMQITSGDPNGEIVNTFQNDGGGDFDLPTRTYNSRYIEQSLIHQCQAVFPSSILPGECQTPSPTPTPPQEVCNSPYFDKFKAGIGSSHQGPAADAGYTLPFRNTSANLTDAMKAEAIKLMGPQYMNGGATGIANINKYWNQIGPTAKKYGWNPVFVVTLWIEESGAGGNPNGGYDLGCLAGWDKPNGQGPAVTMPKIPATNVCDEMACLFSHPVKNANDFSGFMCSYNSDPTSYALYHCQASQGWEFPQTVKTIWDLLMGAK